MKLDIYSDDHLAYVTVSEEEVARTVELTESILVDFDAFNMVIGVEFLDLDARIPFDRLVSECHVDSKVIEDLRRIQPTINGFVASIMQTRANPAHVPATRSNLLATS